MNKLSKHKRVIFLFFIYLSSVAASATIYLFIYDRDKNSFIIESKHFKTELLIADNFLKIQAESLLTDEESKTIDHINELKERHGLYSDILKDSLKLVNKYGKFIPQTISFLNFNAISVRTRGAIGWIKSDGNQNYIFFPEYEGKRFRYIFYITDYKLNENRDHVIQRVNVHSYIKDKSATNSVSQDSFSHYTGGKPKRLEEFHNEIITSRSTEIAKSIKSQEVKLNSIKSDLETFRKKNKKPSLRLGWWDFFYFSTNIQTTGDLIDIIPNSTSVRNCISFQRIFNLILLSLVFGYYLDLPKDKK